MTMDLSPLSFFDARSHGLRVNAFYPSDITEEDMEIIRFIRTPGGQGVSALRVGGGGEVWQVSENGREIKRARSWEKADLVVVLAQGKLLYIYICCFYSAFAKILFKGSNLPHIQRIAARSHFIHLHHKSF